ncbi:MAG: MAPEG family protein [Pseudolabrys sp.]|nr:MAPEG family protein [Pseudolabrys sp.]
MPVQFVLLPLFVHVIMTLCLLLWLVPLRARDFRSGVRESDIALGQKAWSPRAQQVANCFDNQFQLPVLFYVLTILSIITRHADIIFVVLAWIFVLTRLGHAFVFVTSNRVQVRGGIYGLGALVLVIAWIIFMVRILAGLP